MKRFLLPILMLCGMATQAFADNATFRTSDIITKGPWVDVRAFSNLSTAGASSPTAGKEIWITSDQTVNTLTIPSDRRLVPKGGIITVNSGKTLTYSGSTTDWPIAQVFAGSGSVTGLKEARPEWWGAVNDVSIQAAVNAVVSGGVVDLSKVTGTVTLAAPVTITNPVTILLGNSTITANLSSQMFLLKSSGVTFRGVKGQSKLTSTNTVTGNIIQWGETGVAHTYNDMKISGIEFTLPVIAYINIDSYRKHLGGIVALTESLTTITANNRLTVTDCVFNEGADQISLEQVNYATIKDNIFNTTNGRGILLWNSDYYVYDGNTLNDTAGTAVNFNESFQTGALNKGCDFGKIVNNTVNGTRYEAIGVKGIGTVVANNIVRNAKGTGIAITDPNTTSTQTVHDVVIIGNTVNCIGGGVGSYGLIVTSGTASAYNILVEGNYFDMTGTSSAGIGATSASSTGITIINNKVIRHDATGANLDGIQVANLSGSEFIGNTISGWTRYGLYMNVASNFSITNNTVRNNTSDGIRLQATTQAYLTANYLSGNGGYGIAVVASDTTYLQIPNTNRFYNNTSGRINTHSMYMGDGTRVDSTVLPVSGYMEAGDIVYRGSGQVGSASSGWVCTTAGWLLKGAWTTGVSYTAGFMVSNAGNIYIATNSGTSGASAPVHGSGTVTDGTVLWRFIAVGAAAVTKTLPAVGA